MEVGRDVSLLRGYSWFALLFKYQGDQKATLPGPSDRAGVIPSAATTQTSAAPGTIASMSLAAGPSSEPVKTR